MLAGEVPRGVTGGDAGGVPRGEVVCVPGVREETGVPGGVVIAIIDAELDSVQSVAFSSPPL